MKLKYLPSTIVTHVSQLVNWLLPQNCFLCGGISDRTLCPACLADLPYQNAMPLS
jgi:hypothetical protein